MDTDFLSHEDMVRIIDNDITYDDMTNMPIGEKPTLTTIVTSTSSRGSLSSDG